MVRLKGVVESTIVSLTIGRIYLNYLDNTGVKSSNNDLLKSTSAAMTAISMCNAAIVYYCSEENLDIITDYMHNMYDSFVFTEEYALDYLTDIFSVA